MRNIRMFMTTMVVSALLLTGCGDYKEEVIKVAFGGYTDATSDYYQFMQSGPYEVADITEYKQTEKESSFFLKEKITYHATYTSDSIITTLTAPLEQLYYADMKNVVKYAVDDDLDFPNVEELLASAYGVNKSGTYENVEVDTTRKFSVLIEKNIVKILIETKIN